MKVCENLKYIWSVSAVFPGTLGRGDIDPVMGEHPLEFSLDRIFPSFGDPYILEADNGGPLLENLMYFLLTLLVSVGTQIPYYCFFHCVGGDGASPYEVHEPAVWESLIGARGIKLHPALSSRKNRSQAVCFLAYDPANPNMFSVNNPSNIMSLLSRL